MLSSTPPVSSAPIQGMYSNCRTKVESPDEATSRVNVPKGWKPQLPSVTRHLTRGLTLFRGPSPASVASVRAAIKAEILQGTEGKNTKDNYSVTVSSAKTLSFDIALSVHL